MLPGAVLGDGPGADCTCLANLFVQEGARVGRARERLPVDVDKPVALRIPGIPLETIEKRSEKVSADVNASIEGLAESADDTALLSQRRAQIDQLQDLDEQIETTKHGQRCLAHAIRLAQTGDLDEGHHSRDEGLGHERLGGAVPSPSA